METTTIERKDGRGSPEAAARARAARTRNKHERWAAEMREAGWDVIAPGETRPVGDNDR